MLKRTMMKDVSRWERVLGTLTAIVLFMGLIARPMNSFAGDTTWSTQVDVWNPPFNTGLKIESASYVPLAKANKEWRIFAFIPHLKDSYWLSANYGLISEARRQGIRLIISEAGGYENLDVQRKQIEDCLATENPDGLIVGAISAKGLNDLIEKAAKQGIPVIDFINTISSPHIISRVATSFEIMAMKAGLYLVEMQKNAGRPIDVAWFPGPRGAGWVEAGVKGFAEAIKGKPVRLVATEYGDTGRSSQGKLISKVLDEYGDELDYIVGTAPTAEAAIPLLRKTKMSDSVQILSYYFTPAIERGIRQGVVRGAPTDSTVALGKITIDTMVRILEKRDYYKHLAPAVMVVDKKNIREWDSSGSLPPRGFRPIFSVNE